ncbi:hypothetical protein N7523_000582 [Penicillium sp. IBT 18751x]|nr:hypothetical protein N7523_000582 [Penicillium sp. IBT 18751x]
MDSDTPENRGSLVDSAYNYKFADRRDKSVYSLRPSSSIKPARARRIIDEARFPHFKESFIEHIDSGPTEASDDAVDLDYRDREIDEKEDAPSEEIVKDDIPFPANSIDFWVLPTPRSPSEGVLAAFFPAPSSKSTNDAKDCLVKRREASLEQEDPTKIDQLSSSLQEKQERFKRQRRY